ncbi:MAG: hypothetical protein ACOC8N_02535 [Spirochaetota bacterium]
MPQDTGVRTLRNADLVMYDRATETLWRRHPEGPVLSRDAGHQRDYGRNLYPSRGYRWERRSWYRRC